MAEALAQAGRWRAAGLAMPVSVNVSALQFQQPGFVDQVAALLAGNGVPADMLELELTESVLLGDIDAIIGQLDRLAALGVRLAIDDFGTGYSGLSYLKRLPIDRLKIDRSFVMDLPGDASDAAITRSVIELARALNLQVIAEGVETEAQRAYLAGLGCHEYQGWLYAPALEPHDFEARVATQPQQASQPQPQPQPQPHAQPPLIRPLPRPPGKASDATRRADAVVDRAATLAA
jgi:EAL domain-containing protein (putative c-di-GMP-specific phosphodiesterase class I)